MAKKPGMSPGTLIHVGKKKIDEPTIEIIDYTVKSLTEKRAKKPEDCFPFKKKPTVTWINVNGLHKIDIIDKLGKHFGLHPLVLEDILNTKQRPKVEDFEDSLFIVLKMLNFDEKLMKIDVEQVSLLLGNNFVISFQEKEGDVFDPIRQRIKGAKGKIRKSGPDYLIYALIDAIIDNYFVVLEKIGDKLEIMEDEVMMSPTRKTLNSIHNLKRELISLRKSVWPLRELINNLLRNESKLFKKSTEIYLRDVYDHTIQTVDTIETYRDLASGLLDVYLSSISNRMNEIMKVLTIFAAIFIPLTFVAGVYGMNFEYMPELKWKYGYLMIWGVMVTMFVSMMFYFKRKKWL